MRRNAALALISLIMASCATAPPPPKAPPAAPARLPSAPAVHTTGFGPPKGFAITQELTSLADILWEGDLPGKGPVRQKREAGLRILASFEVLERGESIALIRAYLEKTDILQEGKFIPAPFLQFNPPSEITFRVNYRLRNVDFGPAERAWSQWANGLKGTPTGDILFSAFDVKTYLAQLKGLLGRTALDFAGNTYSFGRTIREKQEFFVPLPGAGISVGPLDVDLGSSLRYVEVAGGRKIFRIRGDQTSRFLRFDAASLGARLRALGGEVPAMFDSDGTITGTVEAQVDADTGWTTETYADFTAMTTSGFQGGTFTETVKGIRIAVPRQAAQ